jgi:hypothetical protein
MTAGMGKNQSKRQKKGRKEGRKEGRNERRNKETNKQTKEERKNLQTCQCCTPIANTVPLVTAILGHSRRVSTACFNEVFQI